MLAAALVTFTGLVLVASHLEPQTLRRMAGYKLQVDIVLHATIILLFHGTFAGLMQAEAAGILISLSLRAYRWAFGYEVYGRIPTKGRKQGRLSWLRYAGKLTNTNRGIARFFARSVA